MDATFTLYNAPSAHSWPHQEVAIQAPRYIADVLFELNTGFPPVDSFVAGEEVVMLDWELEALTERGGLVVLEMGILVG